MKETHKKILFKFLHKNKNQAKTTKQAVVELSEEKQDEAPETLSESVPVNPKSYQW